MPPEKPPLTGYSAGNSTDSVSLYLHLLDMFLPYLPDYLGRTELFINWIAAQQATTTSFLSVDLMLTYYGDLLFDVTFLVSLLITESFRITFGIVNPIIY
ncbi:hypothetical protein L596_015905 [Steinernema carpocapsae]|uniref:Uncharacterized protein n=1 Tax=Steinernema carpocapsae TaxID=34508 RepID=A0A4U5NHE8_STECR|nr:hypothetical protein L596_015905 [Steinernema carpocapsae]